MADSNTLFSRQMVLCMFALFSLLSIQCCLTLSFVYFACCFGLCQKRCIITRVVVLWIDRKESYESTAAAEVVENAWLCARIILYVFSSLIVVSFASHTGLMRYNSWQSRVNYFDCFLFRRLLLLVFCVLKKNVNDAASRIWCYCCCRWITKIFEAKPKTKRNTGKTTTATIITV